MSLNYLEGQNDNLYAIKRLGSTFSDALLGRAQAQLRQQQLAQQAFLQSQYLKLSQEKEARDKALAASKLKTADVTNQQKQGAMDVSQQVARLQTQRQLDPQAFRQILLDPKDGPRMVEDLRSVGAVPNGEFQIPQDQLMQRLAIALSGRLTGTAASTPAGAGKLVAPVIMGPNKTAFDPISRQPEMATGPGEVSPYQSRALAMRDEEFKQKMGQTNSAHEQSYNATLARNAETQRHNKAMESKSKGKGKFEDKLKTASGDTSASTNGGDEVPTFSSEEEARAAGHKAGSNDVVRIKGVGVVKLN